MPTPIPATDELRPHLQRTTLSPLKQINDPKRGQLALAWYVGLGHARAREATPVVVDGVMYFTTAWSKVMRESRHCEKLWSYDPKFPPSGPSNACCDVVNRGVAVWQGKSFPSPRSDGRLVARSMPPLANSFGKTLTVGRNYRLLLHYRCAPRREEQSPYREWWIRIRRARYISPTMRKLEKWPGASTLFPAILPNHSNLPR